VAKESNGRAGIEILRGIEFAVAAYSTNHKRMEWANETSMVYAQFYLSASRSCQDARPETVSTELVRLHQRVKSISTLSLRERAKKSDSEAILEFALR